MAGHDLVPRNRTVLDGSGGEPIEADIAPEAGRIVAVGKVMGSGGDRLVRNQPQ